ncbi:MAG: protein kinase [Actinomycetota bacterium]
MRTSLERAYLAPEQIDGTAIGAYTDVHAVGLILCELLTGELPWPRVESLGAMVRQRATQQPRSVAEITAAAPPALGALIDRSTAVDPARRPPTARAFATELQAAMESDHGPGWLAGQSLRVVDDPGTH